jgi:hypothetical protein
MAGEDQARLERRVAELAELEFRAAGLPEELAVRYRVTSDAAMTAMGLERYWRKHHPEMVTPS